VTAAFRKEEKNIEALGFLRKLRYPTALQTMPPVKMHHYGCWSKGTRHHENERNKGHQQRGSPLRFSIPNPPSVTLFYMPWELPVVQDFDSDNPGHESAIVNVGCANRLVCPRSIDHGGKQRAAISSCFNQHEVRMGTKEGGAFVGCKPGDRAQRSVRRESSNVFIDQIDADPNRADKT